MDRAFVSENARERERLRRLVERITDGELGLPMGRDRTIAAALRISRFGTKRALVLTRKWKVSGVAL